MTLTFCWNLSAADWIVNSGLPWDRLVGFGPAGFDAYGRLRFLPDPTRPGQPEHEADAGRRLPQLPTLWEVLATHTATPDDCYFCVWEGFGDSGMRVGDDDAVYIHDDNAHAQLEATDAQPGVAPEPAESSSLPKVPTVIVPNRAYWLFRGPLADAGSWDTAQGWPSRLSLHRADPAFVWPADHAWCFALDVDPHWAGIGGNRTLISELMTDLRLDVVPADPTGDQPFYY